MTYEFLESKLNNNEELSNNDLAHLLLMRFDLFRTEFQDDINRLALLTMNEFGKIRVEMRETEDRLSRKIEWHSKKVNKRIDMD